ncbi:hypothetical protein BRADI_1g35896v3 [Brachypodium distachyon]|uniref:Uncharacterized protein n=1 Tax=Brachypodium distachyon TaxID=15368 RepID=A0A2K2DMY6_BRADI|nr:hypothetical protein BRADI_1g35896v3 [Brachypodium distachyon]
MTAAQSRKVYTIYDVCTRQHFPMQYAHLATLVVSFPDRDRRRRNIAAAAAKPDAGRQRQGQEPKSGLESGRKDQNSESEGFASLCHCPGAGNLLFRSGTSRTCIFNYELTIHNWVK